MQIRSEGRPLLKVVLLPALPRVAAGTLNAILNVIGDYASHPKKKRNLADLKSGLEAVLSPPRQKKKMKVCKAPVKKPRHLHPPQVASS